MAPSIILAANKHHTPRAPLAVLGYCLTQSQFLAPLWKPVHLTSKVYRHRPTEKLQDILVAILAGCRSLSQVNTRLRPDKALAQAWERPQFADQSTLSRTLDSLESAHIEQLRIGHLALLKQYSHLRHHDWQKPLMLDIDATSLLASKRAEGSRKGWVSGHKNRYCRHVLRFMLAGYHETLLSLVFAGDRHGFEHFKPAMHALQRHWPWSRAQRQRIILRADAGLGTDSNVRYSLRLGFQILMKMYSGRRTQAWQRQTQEAAWIADPQHPHRWMAPVSHTWPFGPRVQAYLLRWQNRTQKLQHATLLTTLPCADAPFSLWDLYDGRGASEIEFRADKSGLKLHLRRKHHLTAMEAWVILTDIAHNLLSWLRSWCLADSAFAAFGPKRFVEDLLTIPGHLCFEEGQLVKVTLDANHPYAPGMASALHNMLKCFDLA